MAKKKSNTTVVNNIDFVNVEIDYDKLAEAIVKAEKECMHGYEYSAEFTIPAMSAVYYKKENNDVEGI